MSQDEGERPPFALVANASESSLELLLRQQEAGSLMEASDSKRHDVTHVLFCGEIGCRLVLQSIFAQSFWEISRRFTVAGT